ncbi:MAG: hypothetical protein EZS28_002446, partial [Streblomastix strix]
MCENPRKFVPLLISQCMGEIAQFTEPYSNQNETNSQSPSKFSSSSLSILVKLAKENMKCRRIVSESTSLIKALIHLLWRRTNNEKLGNNDSNQKTQSPSSTIVTPQIFRQLNSPSSSYSFNSISSLNGQSNKQKRNQVTSPYRQKSLVNVFESQNSFKHNQQNKQFFEGGNDIQQQQQNKEQLVLSKEEKKKQQQIFNELVVSALELFEILVESGELSIEELGGVDSYVAASQLRDLNITDKINNSITVSTQNTIKQLEQSVGYKEDENKRLKVVVRKKGDKEEKLKSSIRELVDTGREKDRLIVILEEELRRLKRHQKETEKKLNSLMESQQDQSVNPLNTQKNISLVQQFDQTNNGSILLTVGRFFDSNNQSLAGQAFVLLDRRIDKLPSQQLKILSTQFYTLYSDLAKILINYMDFERDIGSDNAQKMIDDGDYRFMRGKIPGLNNKLVWGCEADQQGVGNEDDMMDMDIIDDDELDNKNKGKRKCYACRYFLRQKKKEEKERQRIIEQERLREEEEY